MKRPEFYQLLAYRMDIPLDKAKNFSRIFEQLILEIIATEDQICLEFGTIGGMTKEPIPVSGYLKKVTEEEWTNAKFGYPYIRWSKKALDCVKQNGREYLSERGLTELFKQKYKKENIKNDINKRKESPE